jgi:ribose transport system ATP-binding protein
VEQASPLVSFRNVSKTFGATRALREVTLDVWPGEVQALVGQNGSGKSTLVKILSGYHDADEGSEVLVDGEPVRLPLGHDELERHGFTFVHQDLGLADSLSIVDNARVGSYKTGPMWRIDWRVEEKRVRGLLSEYGLDVDPRRPVADLSVAERTIVAIVRALRVGSSDTLPRLIVADEPTSYLPYHERSKLFAAFRQLTKAGVGVLFVTHRLDEIGEVADRVSVLRDGSRVGTWLTSETSQREVLVALVGRDLESFYPDSTSSTLGEPIVTVRNLSLPPLEEVSFDIHRGEILGVAGLMGMGQDEVPYLIYGARAARSGEITINGSPYARPSPQRSLEKGIALLPGDRHREGAIMSVSIAENVTMPTLDRYWASGRLHNRRELADVGVLLKEFQVRPQGMPRMKMSAFSGGNQQKALMGKWLRLPGLKVLLLHEPTQGVDVGSRKLLFDFIQQAAEQGIAVLWASAEYRDLAHLCDRILVIRGGRIAAELRGADVNYDRLLEQCYASLPVT